MILLETQTELAQSELDRSGAESQRDPIGENAATPRLLRPDGNGTPGKSIVLRVAMSSDTFPP